MTSIEIALKFAEYGFHVFPLYGPKKSKPFGWSGSGTVDPEHIDKVIAATDNIEFIQSWPEQVKSKYNSTISGFGILGVNCVILDIDMKNGKDGMTQFAQLMSLHNVPRPTMFTVTKSGGLHAFYKRPDKLREVHVKTLANVQVNGVKYDGIDLRGNGGFVVGPEEIANESSLSPGTYRGRHIKAISELPEFPYDILQGWTRSVMTNDLDNLLFEYAGNDNDYKSQIRRGIIPDSVPKGARNETFYVFINVLKSKGVPRDAARQMCDQLAKVVEEPETLAESVNIEEMLDRVYIVRSENPYDIAVDLINHGFFQLTNYKSKLHYIILEDNPYIASRNPHDETTMKTLLARFQKHIQTTDGKTKLVNPMEVVTRVLHDENRVDALGFKPNGGQVFTLHDDPGAKRFLNTYKPVPIPKSPDGLDLSIWDEFTFIVSRIFGAQGTDEYQLGLDFIAWLVQRPQEKPSIAPFIMSHQRGVGKSLFFNIVIQILGTSKDGERQGRLTKLDEITGRFFNPAGCLLNLVDEVQFPVHRDTRKESVTFWRHLKNLITAETISVEIKGGATYQLPNSAALILAGNTGSHFPVEEMDRRLWIIDANPPLLERGVADRLFMIIKGQGLGPDDRIKLLSSLRYQLAHHKIGHDLSSLRAPMTDVKRDMFMNSLTDTEEWFISHFESNENLFAATPIITMSAFVYVVTTSDRLMNSKWREDIDGFFRDMKRRGLLRPIRSKSNSNTSRNMEMPIVSPDGTLFQNNKREVVYTTREHGSFDNAENKEIMHAFMRNAHTIKHFKGHVKRAAITDLQNDIESMNS